MACSAIIMKLHSESTEVIDRFRMLFMNDSRTCTFKEQAPEASNWRPKNRPFSIRRAGKSTELGYRATRDTWIG